MLNLDVDMSGGLDELVDALRALGDTTFMTQVYDDAGAACADLVRQGFANGTAPDGSAWAPTKAGNSPPLTRTGALRNSVTHVVTPTGFELRITDAKGPYHQRGTRRGIPARPMLPDGALPPAYADEVEKAFKQHVEKVFGR